VVGGRVLQRPLPISKAAWDIGGREDQSKALNKPPASRGKEIQKTVG
jgi:hypothetical protein